MTLNSYFNFSTPSEQNLLEDLIIESIQIYGQEFIYIPRTLVAKDEILGEDRLSEFKNAYPIEMYFENVDAFDGQGSFLQKFGHFLEQSATLVVAQKRWEQLIGAKGTTILPNRPAEGDLIYFPMTSGLFEIKFVKHEDPFYQLGKLYVYKLQVELFQYASENIETGIEEIDAFESLKTFNTDPEINERGFVSNITVTNGGSGYTTASVSITSDTGIGFQGSVVLDSGSVSAVIIDQNGLGYTDNDIITITGNGTGALVEFSLDSSIDIPDSYGDNDKFKDQSSFLFDTDNPFGDVR
jgi:hypothetical protein